MKVSRDLLLEFWDLLHISATFDARNFKFGMQIDHWEPKRSNAKLGQMGSTRVHVTYFLQFRDPSIYLERLKLETSTLAHRLATGGRNKNG